MLKLIQLSDCHLSADRNARYRGINPRETLQSLLPVIEDWKPDLVLATGDLAEDGSEEVYHYLADRLGALGAPVLTVPGNHDRPALQKSCFPYTPVGEPLFYTTAGWRLILLNSAADGKIHGELSAATTSGMKHLLSNGDKPVLVVVHHQPLEVGSPWIDRHALHDREKFWELLDGATQVKAVLWGHVHQDFRARRNGICLLGAPSTAANSLPGREKFTFDPAGPACRWLRLKDDGLFETGLLGWGE